MDDISESVLDKDSSEVATTISGFVAKKPIKRSKGINCQAKLKSNNNDFIIMSISVCYLEEDYSLHLKNLLIAYAVAL